MYKGLKNQFQALQFHWMVHSYSTEVGSQICTPSFWPVDDTEKGLGPTYQLH